MNRKPRSRGWLRRLLERLGRGKVYEKPIRFLVSRADEDDDQDEGLGVPVPAGPRPPRGGAQASPPEK